MCPPPEAGSFSLSVNRRPPNDEPRSWRSLPIAAIEPKSCEASVDAVGPGMIALPQPRSSVTRSVYAVESTFPVARAPQRGDVIVRV